MAEQRTEWLCKQLLRIDSKRDLTPSSEESDAGEASQDEGLPASEYGDVQAGTVLKEGRYVIIERVGSGHFSAVFLAFDVQERRSVAVKVQRSAEHYIATARDEIELLTDLRMNDPEGVKPVVHLFDSFEHHCDGGNPPETRKLHICTVFEVLGKTLLSLIRRCKYDGAPLPLVKIIARQVLEGLHFVHTRCNIIHTDLKPENVMFQLTKEQMSYVDREVAKRANIVLENGSNISQYKFKPIMRSFSPEAIDLQFAVGKVKIIDFGNACWTYKQFVSDIQTRQYRCPEAIIGAGYDTAADIWSAACVIFEILTGEYLFDPQSSQSYSRDEDHLAMMKEIVGSFPHHFILKGAYSEDFFTGSGRLRHIHNTNYIGITRLLMKRYRFPYNQAQMVSNFLQPMLQINPAKRATAAECLEHPFLNEATPQRSSSSQHRHSRHRDHRDDSSSHSRRDEDRSVPKSKYQRAYRKLFNG